MAKDKNNCPISGKACKNCPLFRGRHFNQCFHANYQDYINNLNSDKELLATKYGWCNLDNPIH